MAIAWLAYLYRDAPNAVLKPLVYAFSGYMGIYPVFAAICLFSAWTVHLVPSAKRTKRGILLLPIIGIAVGLAMAGTIQYSQSFAR